MLIPALVNNCRVYIDGEGKVGEASVELPSFEMVTETVDSFGVAGPIEMPIKGHVKSMTVTLKYNSLTNSHLSLLRQNVQELDVRASMQGVDSETGGFREYPLKVWLRGLLKSFKVGKVEVGKKMEAEQVLEVLYIVITSEDYKMVEYDKLNLIFVVDGVDYLEEVRKNIT